jgi:Ca2+-binding EF-hand superfamily protein
MSILSQLIDKRNLEKIARQLEKDPTMRALYEELKKQPGFDQEVELDFQEIMEMLTPKVKK